MEYEPRNVQCLFAFLSRAVLFLSSGSNGIETVDRTVSRRMIFAVVTANCNVHRLSSVLTRSTVTPLFSKAEPLTVRLIINLEFVNSIQKKDSVVAIAEK